MEEARIAFNPKLFPAQASIDAIVISKDVHWALILCSGF